MCIHKGNEENKITRFMTFIADLGYMKNSFSYLCVSLLTDGFVLMKTTEG
jgi:hypothetical protein